MIAEVQDAKVYEAARAGPLRLNDKGLRDLRVLGFRGFRVLLF